MKLQQRQTTKEDQLEDAVTVTVPANALETIVVPLGGPLGSGHSAIENATPIMAAALGRDESFLCYRKPLFGSLLVVKVT